MELETTRDYRSIVLELIDVAFAGGDTTAVVQRIVRREIDEVAGPVDGAVDISELCMHWAAISIASAEVAALVIDCVAEASDVDRREILAVLAERFEAGD